MVGDPSVNMAYQGTFIQRFSLLILEYVLLNQVLGYKEHFLQILNIFYDMFVVKQL
jgi:hypothetical protein